METKCNVGPSPQRQQRPEPQIARVVRHRQYRSSYLTLRHVRRHHHLAPASPRLNVWLSCVASFIASSECPPSAKKSLSTSLIFTAQQAETPRRQQIPLVHAAHVLSRVASGPAAAVGVYDPAASAKRQVWQVATAQLALCYAREVLGVIFLQRCNQRQTGVRHR